MMVRFRTDGSQSAGGFAATYTSNNEASTFSPIVQTYLFLCPEQLRLEQAKSESKSKSKSNDGDLQIMVSERFYIIWRGQTGVKFSLLAWARGGGAVSIFCSV